MVILMGKLEQYPNAALCCIYPHVYHDVKYIGNKSIFTCGRCGYESCVTMIRGE